MVFMPGKSGNPSGRPKCKNLMSEDYQAFYEKNKEDIQKVAEKLIAKALDEQEPWAIKLCMEYFWPKPQRSVAIINEESPDVAMDMSQVMKTLSLEDKQTFLKIWMKMKKGVPAFESSMGLAMDEDDYDA